jgi:hypothetical protein
MPDADGPVLATPGSARGIGPRGLTRREGLVALALLTPVGILAACTGSTGPPPGSATASAPPPDLAADVAAEESALMATYDAVLSGVPGLDEAAAALLGLIRDQHAQHLEALGGSGAQPPASVATAPATAAAAVTSLIAAERAAARSRIRACVVAEDAELARLLTFIGASEASHVPALRDLPAAGA